jgi:hypothetical protein
MLNHYRRSTGLDDVKIKEYLLPAQDRWLSAEEALSLKICDSISYPQPVQQTQQSTAKKVKSK